MYVVNTLAPLPVWYSYFNSEVCTNQIPLISLHTINIHIQILCYIKIYNYATLIVGYTVQTIQ